MGQEFHRSVGLELAGAKSHRSSVAVLDYYPATERLVLLDIKEGIHDEARVHDKSPDEILIEKLKELRKEAKFFAGLSIHGPLSFPSYLEHPSTKKLSLNRAGSDAEARWMFDQWERLKPQPRPFVPYLQRPCEIWLRYCTNEKFLVTDAFGSNAAPLAARLRVLQPYLPQPLSESLPRATLSRVVGGLQFPKWITADYSDVERGVKAREEFITNLMQKIPQIFIYERDFESMVTHLSCFNAFLSALNQFLHSKKYCEMPPRTFPKQAAWIPIPRTIIDWDKVFRGDR